MCESDSLPHQSSQEVRLALHLPLNLQWTCSTGHKPRLWTKTVRRLQFDGLTCVSVHIFLTGRPADTSIGIAGASTYPPLRHYAAAPHSAGGTATMNAMHTATPTSLATPMITPTATPSKSLADSLRERANKIKQTSSMHQIKHKIYFTCVNTLSSPQTLPLHLIAHHFQQP